MSTEQMREEFEAWARDNAMLLFVKVATGKYRSEKTELAWQAWQASRAALVVELPPTITADDVDNEYFQSADDLSAISARMVNGAIAACGAFIKAAGVRVKE